MADENRKWVLASHPVGEVTEENFRLEVTPIPKPEEGQVLIRSLEHSVDPAQRGWISGNKGSYREPIPIGGVIEGFGTGIVIESKSPNFSPGDRVAGPSGWVEYSVHNAATLRKLPPGVPTELFLGAAGITGLTAYFGLLEIGKPKEGETVLVSGAAGATGSIVVQLAKIKGCHVVALAGTDEKCKIVKDEFGADSVINYKGKSYQELVAAIKEACPKGIDVYFDNVGGDILEIALQQINNKGRVVCCGSISGYNATAPVPGPKGVPSILVVRRVRMEGFIVTDFQDQFASAIGQLLTWINEGKLKHKDTIVEGFEKLPQTFRGLFKFSNK